jgi:hypothetical protein
MSSAVGSRGAVTILFIGPSHPCELPVAMHDKYKVTGPASTGERPQ